MKNTAGKSASSHGKDLHSSQGSLELSDLVLDQYSDLDSRVWFSNPHLVHDLYKPKPRPIQGPIRISNQQLYSKIIDTKQNNALDLSAEVHLVSPVVSQFKGETGKQDLSLVLSI